MGRSLADRRARRFIWILAYPLSNLWISKALTRSYFLQVLHDLTEEKHTCNTIFRYARCPFSRP